MTSSPNTLKPCPFCGGDMIGIFDDSNMRLDRIPKYKWVQCFYEGCETRGPACENEEEAIQKWNTRAE